MTVIFRLPINFNANRKRDFTTEFRNLAKRLLAVVLLTIKIFIMKIDFTKLLNGFYPLEVEMEMINWFLKTGNKFDEHVGNWTVDGISKQMFDYSANSNNCKFPFPIKCSNFIGNSSYNFNVLKGFISNCLFNAIIKHPLKPVFKWREFEKIQLGKYRMLNFNLDYPKQEEKHEKLQGIYCGILKLKEIINTPLKKEFFHPDYTERIDPKIIDVVLFTNGNGYVFEYEFSFSNFNYEHGWNKQICQKEGESIACFLNRVFKEIDLVSDVE